MPSGLQCNCIIYQKSLAVKWFFKIFAHILSVSELNSFSNILQFSSIAVIIVKKG